MNTHIRPPAKGRDERQSEEQELDAHVDRAGFSEEDFWSDGARKKWRRLGWMKGTR